MDKEYFVIDRMASAQGVLQSLTSGEIFNVERQLLAADAKEGDVVYIEQGHFILDPLITIERKKNLSKRMNRLFKRK